MKAIGGFHSSLHRVTGQPPMDDMFFIHFFI